MGTELPPLPFGLGYYLGEYRREGVAYSVDVWARSWAEAEKLLAEQHPEGIIIGTTEGVVAAMSDSEG